MKYLIPIALTAVSSIAPLAAAVIQNDAIITPPTGGYVSGSPQDRFFYLTTSAPPGNGMFLYAITTTSPSIFTFTYMGIAEANGIFLVDPNDEFDLGYINSHPYFVTNYNTPGTAAITLLPGESRYLAYYDVRMFTGPDLFGWAKVSNIGGELLVEESATAVGGGIIVATLTQIPEPSVGAVLAASITLGALRRRRSGIF